MLENHYESKQDKISPYIQALGNNPRALYLSEIHFTLPSHIWVFGQFSLAHFVETLDSKGPGCIREEVKWKIHLGWGLVGLNLRKASCGGLHVRISRGGTMLCNRLTENIDQRLKNYPLRGGNLLYIT